MDWVQSSFFLHPKRQATDFRFGGLHLWQKYNKIREQTKSTKQGLVSIFREMLLFIGRNNNSDVVFVSRCVQSRGGTFA